MPTHPPLGLLRSRDHRAHVTNVELFFDLVPYCTPLALGAATTAVLIVVAGWETLSFARA
jgi:hypothetical protein